MRLSTIVLALLLSACQTADSRFDPFRSGVQDYFFGDRADPTANDPVFSEGWDVDGAG